MSLSFDYSIFPSSERNKNFVSLSLKKFSKSPLAQIPKKDLKEARRIWKDITKDHTHILIFAFGGSGSTEKILSSFFPSKSKNIVLIDTVNKKILNTLSLLSKQELKSSHSLFFSKSGKTDEILFYSAFLKKIYTKKHLSLKNKVTIISQSPTSPLLEWAKKERVSVILSKSDLPGRFSFFNFNGFLQAQAYTRYLEIKNRKSSYQIRKALEFFIHHIQRTEIFFCPLEPELEEVSHWLEMSWSESLFKTEAVQQPPLLRKINLSDLRHAYIQELVTKKDKVLFWGFNTKSQKKTYSAYVKQIKNILKTKKIPYIFMNLSLDKKSFPCELMIGFYKILFFMAEISKSNIYTQTWVDYFKTKNSCK